MIIYYINDNIRVHVSTTLLIQRHILVIIDIKTLTMDRICTQLLLLAFISLILYPSGAFMVSNDAVSEPKFVNRAGPWANSEVFISDSGVRESGQNRKYTSFHVSRYEVQDDFYSKSKTAAYILKNQARFFDVSRQRSKVRYTELQRALGPLLDCALCGLVIEDARHLLSGGHSLQELENFLTKVCIRAHIQDKDVCTTVVKTFEVGHYYPRLLYLHIAPHESKGCLQNH